MLAYLLKPALFNLSITMHHLTIGRYTNFSSHDTLKPLSQSVIFTIATKGR